MLPLLAAAGRRDAGRLTATHYIIHCYTTFVSPNHTVVPHDTKEYGCCGASGEYPAVNAGGAEVGVPMPLGGAQ